MKDFFIKAAATGLGIGYIPLMPGTFGSLLGVGICLLLNLGGFPVYIAGVVVLGIAAVKISGDANVLFGEHDSKKIVIDEIVGYLVSMLLIPDTVEYLVAGFIVFRFFDILKPYPAGMVDKKVGGGIGVVLDDVIAGVYTNIVLWAVIIVRGAL
ncbi:MAG: phosphatidylglycerophosphatase A [Deltaproteobacteria bacterium]|uniref:Phosphatidylglycerophosphatase A n=1 Tax=Candidatus Zymogenus saltonus TaxID=2844893 RepID=A0A9D8KG54_9DELT|nr:phosphatidylglycerophosphatase A [Candidatus Zymogenus saltonus]